MPVADYTTTFAVRDYLHLTSRDSDATLARLITRASAMIDTYCGRWFSPVIETRTYAPRGNHITGRLLLLDADLLSVSAITVAGGETLNPTRYILRPVSWPPFFGISLRQNSQLHWATLAGPDGRIAVSGTWGYALVVPDPIAAAAVRLTAWLYRQFDTAVEDPAAEQAARLPREAAWDGQSPVRHSPERSMADDAKLPGEIRQMLGPYVRLRISAYSGAA